MKAKTWIRRGLLGLAGLLLLGLVVAYALPREPTVSRSIEIAAPASDIFPLVSDLRHASEWQPWFERDPDISVTFVGPVEGVGQAMTWESDDPEVGSGRQTVTRLEPGEVETALDFGEQGTAAAFVTLEEAGDTTSVTWGFTTDLGFNPVARYFGLGLDGMVGPDFEEGLANLKTLAETPLAAEDATDGRP